MDPIDFYRSVLPSTGVYCALSINSGGRVTQTFHTSLEELVARAEAIAVSKCHAYFAMSSFRDASSRKADNAAATRAFFLDLDCGVGKPYADQSEAAVALRAFIERMEFPEPTIVNSGRGLHVYWTLKEELATADWVGLALRFKRLCLDSGFPIDPAVPADSARVLRCPGTFNFKDDPAAPVQIMQSRPPISLDDFVRVLPAGTVDLTSAKEFGLDDTTRAIAAGDYPSTNFKRLVQRSLKGNGCAQIVHALQHADTLEEPLWRAALSIAWRCSDAETAIHTLSSKHPEYTPEDTIRKAELTKGPMTCKWYKDNNGAICEGCPHSITSPISLGRKIEAAEEVDGAYLVTQQLQPDNADTSQLTVVKVEIPAYPHPYFRGVNGGVFIRVKDKDGNIVEQQIYPYDLYVTNRFFDADDSGEGEGEMVAINLHTPHDGIRKFKAAVPSLLAKDKLRDLLAKNGVIVYGNEVDKIMAYLASSVKHMQRMFSAERTRSQMGWTQNNEGFVVGELEYGLQGVRLAPAAGVAGGTRAVVQHFYTKGSLEEWSRIANFYNRKGMEAHAFTVLLGFGAPLLKLCNSVDVRGAMINLVSNKGGSGKTTAQMVVNSIFGHPSDLLLKREDTTASKMQWLGMLNSIAVTMDEITNITDEELSTMAYEIPQGRGKHRMNSQTNSLRANNATWTTFAITSSNSSMYSKLFRHKSVADGEIRRLIEIPFGHEHLAHVTKAESDAVFGQLSNNFGLAGPVYLRYIFDNMEEVQGLLAKVRKRIDDEVNMSQVDRYYSYIYACALVGGIIAVKLGLLDYDMKVMFNFAVSLATGIREEVLSEIANINDIAKETILQYINENISNILIINNNPFPNGKALPAPIQNPRTALKMRYEPDCGDMWIPAADLRNLFVERQIDIRAVMPALAAIDFVKHGGKPVPKRIGAGSVGSFVSGNIRCYCINGNMTGVSPDGATADGATATSDSKGNSGTQEDSAPAAASPRVEIGGN